MKESKTVIGMLSQGILMRGGSNYDQLHAFGTVFFATSPNWRSRRLPDLAISHCLGQKGIGPERRQSLRPGAIPQKISGSDRMNTFSEGDVASSTRR